MRLMSSLQLLLLSMINFVIRCWESQYTVVTALLGIYKFGPFPYWSLCHSANPLFPQLLLAQSGSSLSSVLRLGLLGAPVFYSTQLFLFNSLSLSPFSTTFPPLESAWAYCSARSRGSYSLSAVSFSLPSSATSLLFCSPFSLPPFSHPSSLSLLLYLLSSVPTESSLWHTAQLAPSPPSCPFLLSSPVDQPGHTVRFVCGVLSSLFLSLLPPRI